jgi:HSP20 family molecular chaperone IbpA
MLMNWALPVERLRTELEAERSQTIAPAADIVTTDDGYRLVVEMPGVTRENLTIDLENDTLTLRGARQAMEKDKSLLLNGRLADRPFEKRFVLGRDLDRAQIQAKLENGLLTVTLPRREDTKPTRIEVSVG